MSSLVYLMTLQVSQSLRCFNTVIQSNEWIIPEKIHTPTTEGMLENLTGRGVNSSGNSDVRGALNLKIHPRG